MPPFLISSLAEVYHQIWLILSASQSDYMALSFSTVSGQCSRAGAGFDPERIAADGCADKGRQDC